MGTITRNRDSWELLTCRQFYFSFKPRRRLLVSPPLTGRNVLFVNLMKASQRNQQNRQTERVSKNQLESFLYETVRG